MAAVEDDRVAELTVIEVLRWSSRRTSVTCCLPTAGAFALWPDEPPEPEVVRRIVKAFEQADAHVVPFPDPLTGGESANTAYLATEPRR